VFENGPGVASRGGVMGIGIMNASLSTSINRDEMMSQSLECQINGASGEWLNSIEHVIRWIGPAHGRTRPRVRAIGGRREGTIRSRAPT
jgi:hypothetical protein